VLVLLQVSHSCGEVLDFLCVSFSGNYVRCDNAELRYTAHPLTDERCAVVVVVGAPQAKLFVREYEVVGFNEIDEAREYVSREAEPLQFSVGVLAKCRDGCAPAVAQVICAFHGFSVVEGVDDEGDQGKSG